MPLPREPEPGANEARLQLLWRKIRCVRGRRSIGMPETKDPNQNFRLTVNGTAHTLALDPSTPLLYALSDDLGLRGPKFGCGLGQCGACTVIMNGQAIRSCITPVESVQGAEITTLEGIGTVEKPHPLQ